MGAFGINLLLLAISFISLAIAGGFITNASVRITGIPNWDNNPDLVSAHRYSYIAAIITWITVAAILVLGIVYIIYGSEIGTLTGFTKFVVYGFLILSLGATIAIGILSAIAAQKIANSGVANNNEARRQAIIAAVLAIVCGVGLLIGFVVMLFRHEGSSTKSGLEEIIKKEEGL